MKSVLLLEVERKIEVGVPQLGIVQARPACTGEVGLDIHSDVIADIAGEDKTQPAEEEGVAAACSRRPNSILCRLSRKCSRELRPIQKLSNGR